MADVNERLLGRLRTKQGTNGARFFDVPGVTYPEEVLTGMKVRGLDGRRVAVKECPREGWLPTTACAELLDCTPAAARMQLAKKGVRCELVKQAFAVTMLFWEPKGVQKIVDGLLPVIDGYPDGCVGSETAARLLECSRTTLYRLYEMGKVAVRFARLRTCGGTRKVCFFERAELDRVAPMVKEQRALEARMRELSRRLRGGEAAEGC